MGILVGLGSMQNASTSDNFRGLTDDSSPLYLREILQGVNDY
jgi:hypothetical protein